MKIISMTIVTVKGVKSLNLILQTEAGLIPVEINSKDHADKYNKVLSVISEMNTGGVDKDEAIDNIIGIAMPIVGLSRALDEAAEHLGGNLYIKNSQVFFGDEVLEDTLSSYILSLIDSEHTPKDADTWNALLRFIDNLHQNVNPEIRKQLFRWMNYELDGGFSFTITDDGCFIGYKGVNGDILSPTSVNHGTAYVNGVKHTGAIPNPIGSVISMPRNEVQFDPSVGCSTGLHVGTYNYASHWGELLLTVKVNPRDVVSVPTECESQKIRCCEYTVLGVVTSPLQSRVLVQRDNSELSDSDYDTYVELDELDYDMPLKVTYRRSSGEVVEVTGEVANIHDESFVLRLHDGGYRTIADHKILELLTVDFDDCDDCYHEDCDTDSEVSVGDGVVIKYYSKTAFGEKTISGVVRELSVDSILVFSSTLGHRRIKLSNVIDLAIL